MFCIIVRIVRCGLFLYWLIRVIQERDAINNEEG